MNSSLGAMFLGGFAALLSPVGLGILPLMMLSGVAVSSARRRSFTLMLAIGMALFSVLALREVGAAWPMMDNPSRALSQPLSWLSAALLIAIVVPPWKSEYAAAIRIVLVFVVAALMRPALHGPRLSLAHAVYPDSSAWLGRSIYHLGSALGLAVVLLSCVWLSRRFQSKRTMQIPQLLLLLVAASLMLGIYGAFLRELLARWPTTMLG